MYLKFHQKKRLLEERDETFEQIGQQVFDEQRLPQEFASLPKEFSAVDLVITQMKDRYRVLKEDRDVVHYDYAALQNQAAQMENDFEKSLRPLLRDANEINLKIQHLRDQRQKNPKRFRDSELLTNLDEQSADLTRRVNIIREEKQEATQALRTKMAPLEHKLANLDRSIRKAAGEEQRLSLARKKRLLELGRYYYEQELEPERFATQYASLGKLSEQLADNRKDVVLHEPEATAPAPTNQRLLFGLLAAVIAIMFLFRTQYRTAEIDLGFVARAFPQETGEWRFFWEPHQAPEIQGLSVIPELASLPGGEAFRDMQREDLNSLLLSRQGDPANELRFCGLTFREAPTRVASRLAGLGWAHRPTQLRWEALTNGQWVWLVLNDFEYVLVREAELDLFASLEHESDEANLRFEHTISPLGNNFTLAQGVSQVSIILTPLAFSVSLIADRPFLELASRKRRLARMQEQRMETDPAIRFVDDHTLLIEGSRGWWQAETRPVFDPEALVFQLMGETQRRVVDQKSPSHLPVEQEENDLSTGRAGIMVLALNELDDGLVDQAARSARPVFWGQGPLSNAVFLNEPACLLVADKDTQVLHKLSFGTGQLQEANTLALDGTMALRSGFGPERRLAMRPDVLRLTPDERYLVVLERQPLQPGKAQVLLVRTEDMVPVWLEELPLGVRHAETALWDHTGHTLLVGTQARGPNRLAAWGVLMYRRESEVLHLSRFIDFDSRNKDHINITGLGLPRNQDALIALQMPAGQVRRFVPERDRFRAMESLTLRSEMDRGAGQLGVGMMILNRTGDRALVVLGGVGTGAGAESKPSAHLLRLSESEFGAQTMLSLEDQPTTLTRIPLSDRFIIGSAQGRTLSVLRLHGDEMNLEHRVQLNQFAPYQLTCDRLGDYLFISGIGFPGQP